MITQVHKLYGNADWSKEAKRPTNTQNVNSKLRNWNSTNQTQKSWKYGLTTEKCNYKQAIQWAILSGAMCFEPLRKLVGFAGTTLSPKNQHSVPETK